MMESGNVVALVTVKDILGKVEPGWGVAAFNIHNLDDARAVVEGAQQVDSPVILLVSQSAINYAGVAYISRIARTAAEMVKVPVAVQLDHGQSFELAVDCMRHGFSGVMFDGSHLPFEENVALTKKVVEVAKIFGVSVEGELGVLGGKEDDLIVDQKDALLTDPQQAVKFVAETGIDVLAPAIGTAHGFYKQEPKLDFTRLKNIYSLVDVPIALHGSSGLSNEVLHQALASGASKVNIGTDLKAMYVNSIREFLEENPKEHEPRKVLGYARSTMFKLVQERLQLLGSAGKAW
jgi:fructose-bisphosphate aldolase class II